LVVSKLVVKAVRIKRIRCDSEWHFEGLASWVSSWECLYECYVGTVGLRLVVYMCAGLVKVLKGRSRVALVGGVYVFACYGVTVGSKASSLSIL